MGQFAALRTQKIDCFEDLDEVVQGSRREILQVESGKLSGQMSHASIGDLPIDVAAFNLGLRSTGASVRDRTSIAMLTGSADRATWSSYELRTGDTLVMPPNGDHENRYYGGASILVISISEADIESSFGSESQLGDPLAWRRNHFKGDAVTVQRTIPRLQSLVARLGQVSPSAQAAEFWKRAVIESMTASIVMGSPSERDGPLPSALKVVKRVEEYLDAFGPGPIHISQICGHLHVSRRTLHRAFNEALGIGPIAFLRHRRLCAVHTMLRSGSAVRQPISDLAMQFGFQNLGRFAGYYHTLFGEYPSETRQRHARGLNLPDGQISFGAHLALSSPSHENNPLNPSGKSVA
jgi:AraC family ethanolamine operon transcriptional activator